MKIRKHIIALLCCFVGVVLILVAIFMKSPKYIGEIVDLSDVPAVFIVKETGGYQDLNVEIPPAFGETLNQLQCRPIKSRSFHLVHGDIVLIYNDYGIIITQESGHVYSLTDERQIYKIIETEEIVKIATDLSK